MQKSLTLTLTGDQNNPMSITGHLGNMTPVEFFAVVFRHSKEWRDMIELAINQSMESSN